MGPRRHGRELAVQALYQVELTEDASAHSLALFLSHFEGGAEAKEFARRLIDGVLEHRKEIDRQIGDATENWKLERIAKVELVILRLATYELLFCPDIPQNVSLDEAIEIAKRFGSDDSPTFINGVLDKIAANSRPKSEKAN
jgi:N utilization substance protein B